MGIKNCIGQGWGRGGGDCPCGMDVTGIRDCMRKGWGGGASGSSIDVSSIVVQVRQFMTGIKNYLVKHGEGQLEELIERERAKVCTCAHC